MYHLSNYHSDHTNLHKNSQKLNFDSGMNYSYLYIKTTWSLSLKL